MGKYIKRHVAIEAVQWTTALAHSEGQKDWPEWLKAANQLAPDVDGAFFFKEEEVAVFVRNNGSDVMVKWNDWILQGVEGEIYPCPHSVFKATYYPAGDCEAEQPPEPDIDKDPTREPKSLHNTDINGTRKNVADVQVFGNGDLFQLICKASSEAQGWMKSTKAMEIPNVGCVVQCTTQQFDKVAEAVCFVPGVRIKLDENGDKRLAHFLGTEPEREPEEDTYAGQRNYMRDLIEKEFPMLVMHSQGAGTHGWDIGYNVHDQDIENDLRSLEIDGLRGGTHVKAHIVKDAYRTRAEGDPIQEENYGVDEFVKDGVLPENVRRACVAMLEPYWTQEDNGANTEEPPEPLVDEGKEPEHDAPPEPPEAA